MRAIGQGRRVDLMQLASSVYAKNDHRAVITRMINPAAVEDRQGETVCGTVSRTRAGLTHRRRATRRFGLSDWQSETDEGVERSGLCHHDNPPRSDRRWPAVEDQADLVDKAWI